MGNKMESYIFVSVPIKGLFCHFEFIISPKSSRLFPNLISPLHPVITHLILDLMTCSLPKNVTTFHREQDGIIHFCLSPNKRGVLALWIYIFTKKIMNFSKLNFSTSFKLPKKPFIGTETKINDSILLPVKSSYIFW